jgi:UDP-N-acetylmuramyl pentapeptide phosphotransferase/UDP-N-acetylglucosamine-1-phosphate transferase
LHLTLIACLAFAAAAIATRAAIPWLRRFGATAEENARTMHQGSVPKGGGAPLLAAAALTLAVVLPFGATPQEGPPPWSIIALGTAILAALSWRDDLGHLPAWIRLPVHIAVAALLVSGVAPDVLLFQGWLPYWADRAAAVLALAWMMNLYNFMDGINAIAGVETVSISLGYIAVAIAASIALPLAPLAAALAGASAGFLIWNARETPLVFLGDVGSVPLGFLMGALMLDLAARGLWAPALILPAYFLADATLTLARRIARSERFWEAHKSHAYQQAAAALDRHLPIARRIAIANVLLIAAAVVGATHRAAGLSFAVLIVAALLLDLREVAQSRSSDSGP